MPTLAQLIAAPTADEIKAKLLSSLQGAGFPITDWESGGVERTMVELEADSLTDLVANGIPEMVGGGFIEYATGDWLTFLAAQLYQLTRYPATFTFQRCRLTCEAGAGPITVNAGDLWALTATGLRYSGPTVYEDDPGPSWTIPDGDSLDVVFQSEFANDSADGLNYIDPAGTITVLQTQVAGLSIDNPAPDFSPVGQTGTGTGSVTPSRTDPGTQPTAHAFDVVIVDTGDLGVATFKYRADGGAFSDEIETAATYELPGGTTIAFADGADSPSFVSGDVYNFATPGSPTLEQGTDEENDGSLQGRCQARWPSLSAIPTEDKYATWAKAASVQVTKVRLSQDATVAGQINIVLAGQAGPVLPAVVNTVAAYIIAREDIGYLSTVASATEQAITTAGTVYAPAAQLATIQAAAQLAWSTYVAATDIAGTVKLSTLIQILRNAGCTDVDDLTLNGEAENVELDANQVATFPGLLSQQITWIAVKA